MCSLVVCGFNVFRRVAFSCVFHIYEKLAFIVVFSVQAGNTVILTLVFYKVVYFKVVSVVEYKKAGFVVAVGCGFKSLALAKLRSVSPKAFITNILVSVNAV